MPKKHSIEMMRCVTSGTGNLAAYPVPEPLDDLGCHSLEPFGVARRRDEGRQTDRRPSEQGLLPKALMARQVAPAARS